MGIRGQKGCKGYTHRIHEKQQAEPRKPSRWIIPELEHEVSVL